MGRFGEKKIAKEKMYAIKNLEKFGILMLKI